MIKQTALCLYKTLGQATWRFNTSADEFWSNTFFTYFSGSKHEYYLVIKYDFINEPEFFIYQDKTKKPYKSIKLINHILEKGKRSCATCIHEYTHKLTGGCLHKYDPKINDDM